MLSLDSVTRQPRHRLLAPVAALAACGALASAADGRPVETLPSAPAPRVTTPAPGITHQRVVRDGGQVVHILRARPGPRVSLSAVMAGGAPTARGSLTGAIGARRDSHGAVAGVNGDFFNFTTGNPSGVVLIDGHLIKEPEPSRSALIIRSDGLLDAAVLSLSGRWQAVDPDALQRFPLRNFQGVNRSAQREAEAILYTAAYGQRTTPVGASRWEVRVRLDADTPLAPGVPVTGIVIDERSGGGMTIGRGHVVLTGVGSSGRTIARDLSLGMRVAVTPGLVSLPGQEPLSPEAISAIGGGPLLVRDGAPVVNSGEGLSSAQTGTRTTRTAVGQTGDGTILLVTAEGAPQGSPGITAAEQARLMSELGARVAVAMDAGGSAQMALGTRPLVASAGSPRSLATVFTVDYRGLLLDELPDRISPNADRVGDAALATVRTPVAGRVRLAIVHRSGRPARSLWAGDLGGSSARVLIDPRKLRLRDGIYVIVARMTPRDGTPEMELRRRVIVDRTLGALTARPSGRGARARVTVGFRLQRPARVSVLVRNASGRVVAVLARNRPARAGTTRIVWNRRHRGKPVAGVHRVEVVAASAFGRSGLVRTVALRR
jgi:hypothetical protein